MSEAFPLKQTAKKDAFHQSPAPLNTVLEALAKEIENTNIRNRQKNYYVHMK